MKIFKKIMLSGLCGIVFGLFTVGSIGACILVADALGYHIVGKGESAEPVKYVEEWREKDTTADSDDVDEPTQLLHTNTGTVTTVVTDVTNVVDDVMPSIVSITNEYTYNNYYYSSTAEAKGSGIIIGQNDDELLIATNNHVISSNEELTVTFCDESEASAVVKGTDADMDIAVIAVKLDDIDAKTMDSIAIASIGDSDALRVGEPVVAIGNALGYGQSVTTGVVSALNREMDMGGNGNKSTFIQTDAAINQGNSGGALLNMAGEVIGINSNKIGGSTVEGMGYAIPISAAKPIIEDLMNRETRYQVAEDDKGCIGIAGTTVSAEQSEFYGVPQGAHIEKVYDDSAADEAGLKKGDIITKFDGQTISSMEQLQNVLKYYEEGETVDMVIYHYTSKGYKEKTVTITLGSMDDIN